MTKMKDTTTASDATSDVFELCGALERLPSDVLLPDTLCGDAVLGSPCGVAADAGLCSPGVCATPAFAKEKGGDDWIDTYLRSNDCAAGTCCHYWCSQKRREANKENSAGASNSACSGEESTECKSKGAGSKSRMESLLSELSQPKPETNCQVVAAGSAEAKARKSKGERKEGKESTRRSKPQRTPRDQADNSKRADRKKTPRGLTRSPDAPRSESALSARSTPDLPKGDDE